MLHESMEQRVIVALSWRPEDAAALPFCNEMLIFPESGPVAAGNLMFDSDERSRRCFHGPERS
jgi:hypothetical protein